MKKAKSKINDSDRAKKELIKLLQDAEDYLGDVTKKVAELRDRHEFPYMISKIEKSLVSRKPKSVGASWIQKRLDVGYARACRLLDALEEKGIIHKKAQ